MDIFHFQTFIFYFLLWKLSNVRFRRMKTRISNEKGSCSSSANKSRNITDFFYRSGIFALSVSTFSVLHPIRNILKLKGNAERRGKHCLRCWQLCHYLPFEIKSQVALLWLFLFWDALILAAEWGGSMALFVLYEYAM